MKNLFQRYEGCVSSLSMLLLIHIPFAKFIFLEALLCAKLYFGSVASKLEIFLTQILLLILCQNVIFSLFVNEDW
jgi:hypothetical protein